MMKLIYIIFYIFLSLFSHESFANIQNKIVIKVENEIITNFDIKNKILGSLIISNQEINQENIDKSKKQALESLIQFSLKKIELSKYNLKNDEENIKKYLESISQNNVIGLQNKFINNNLDFELFLDQIKTQFKWQKLIYQIYSSKITIDEKSVNDELQSIIKKRSKIEQYKLSEIEILINNDSSDSERINDIKKVIYDEGFENAALKYSVSSSAINNGDIGWVNAEAMSKPIYDLLKTMSSGEISDPIKRQNSVLFLKLIEKRNFKPEEIDLEKIKNELVNQKKNELFNLYSRSHLSKLRNTSLIEYK